MGGVNIQQVSNGQRRRGGGGGRRPKQHAQQRRRQGPRGRNMRSNADRVLAQGTGATVRKPFGSINTKIPSLACWDAKSPIHLALPRAVADYTVIRLTRRIKTSNKFNLFGSFQVSRYNHFNLDWSNICYVSEADDEPTAAGMAINGPGPTGGGNYQVKGYNHIDFGTTMSWTPSAFTVQVMNGNAIGSTSGIVYGAVMTTQCDLLTNSRSWTDVGNDFVEYQNPRVLSAGKLALRGVQGSSRPFNMSQVSDFTPVAGLDDSLMTADTYSPRPVGWAPIVVYNPGGEPASESLALEFLVTTEYRVRFNISNPACASHSHHPINDDRTWDLLMKKATSMGNGIIDIADVVASTGQAAARAYAKFGPK